MGGVGEDEGADAGFGAVDLTEVGVGVAALAADEEEREGEEESEADYTAYCPADYGSDVVSA